MSSNAQKKPSLAKRIFGAVWRVLLSAFFVCVITGCIVACVLAAYILKYMKSNSDVSLDLRNLQLETTTILYAADAETGENYELTRLAGTKNRVWVDYEDIPQHLINATIAVEDKRFLQHQGVDWIRTTGAFINLFVPIYSGTPGASTITQQLIKNITGDDAVRVERKVQEIFRALNLEKNYSKQEIMEAYLNVVHFGSGTYGVQAAANYYFDKDVWDLSVAESAAIVGITQYPTKYNPLLYPENNKKRRDDIIYMMYQQGMLTEREYSKALRENVTFVDRLGEEEEQTSTTTSWFVDTVIDEVISDMQTELGYSKAYATSQIYSGGYRIYTTVDPEIQDYLEKNFLWDLDTFPDVLNSEYPNAAFVLLGTDGSIKAIAGNNRVKEGARLFNIATSACRHPGSTFKPISSYMLAMEYDMITYSTIIPDEPITIINEKMEEELWPSNDYLEYYGPITVEHALQISANTVAARLTEMLTPKRIHSFLLSNFDLPQIDPVYDVTMSSMALGGMYGGVSPLELAGVYQIYSNGGLYVKPYSYTQVLDSEGNVILQKDTVQKRVISFETATVINKLMQSIVKGGSGKRADLGGVMPSAGKTGTSTDVHDLWYVGITPYYVGVVWMGYADEPARINYNVYSPCPIVWKNIMLPIHENLPIKDFPASNNVVSRTFCTKSGDLATEYCTETATGWYKLSNLPGECTECDGFEVIWESDDDE